METADDMELKALNCQGKGNYVAAASYFRCAAAMFRNSGRIAEANNAVSMMQRAARDAS